jgi:hypothetical protein
LIPTPSTVPALPPIIPFTLQPDQYDLWLGDGWEDVLTKPDQAPLEKFEKQPELY